MMVVCFSETGQIAPRYNIATTEDIVALTQVEGRGFYSINKKTSMARI